MPNFPDTTVPNLPPLPEQPTLQKQLQRRYSLVAPNEPRNESKADETPVGEER
ncbi:hypothetical protein ABZ769_33330 [Streptomyces olivoreticuli]